MNGKTLEEHIARMAPREPEMLEQQKTRLVWMTNGIGEVSHATPGLLLKLGLDSGAWQGDWHPLTKAERAVVAGRCFTMPSGFLAHVGYSAVHQGRKWVVCSVEYTDEAAESDPGVGDALWLTACEEVNRVRTAVETWGGKLFLEEWVREDGHDLSIAFPVNEAMRIGDAEEFAAWLCGLVGGKP